MPMDPNRLWAKSKRDDEDERPSMFLPHHLRDVYTAAEKILDATGDDQLAALGLNPEKYRDRFRHCVLLAAAVHDLGKANSHFQNMIRGCRDVRVNPQGLRHEWVTVLMLQSLKSQLLPALNGSEIDLAIVEWAVAGHHPGHNHASPPTLCPSGVGVEIELLSGHSEFGAILDNFNLKAVSIKPKQPLVGVGNAFIELANWAKRARRLWDDQIRNLDDAKLVAAVKNCLVAADVAGSALPRTSLSAAERGSWISESFAEKPKPGNLQQIVDRRLGKHQPRPFQAAVANAAEGVVFVKAGCGTGKTLAAYMWAAKNFPERRLYFCYPTTGTATEGFKDYLFEPNGEMDDIGAKLFHSRSDIDFEIILNTRADSASSAADTAMKLESLEAWATPIASCTVDTVLGLVQNNKRGLFAWPALAQSAFVFDEIHAYDDRLFGALLRFLRDLPGLPSLLMTASLPKSREEALRRVLEKHRGIKFDPIQGPEDLEQLPRYHKDESPDGDALALVKKTIRSGGKVLWVCNTVNRVIDAADAAEKLGLEPLIYHSRFKYVDRVERHKKVIDAFNPNHTESALAICSQVAEMSLDLKGCTLLVSDIAPVPALIQRLGRLNRQASQGSLTRPFLIINLDPTQHLPYTPADMIAAKTWLENLPNDAISQQDLADQWEQSGDQPPDLVPSAWLDGGPTTSVSELREASPGITVLMREDVAKIKKAKDIGRYTLPMPPPPRRLNWQSWKTHEGIPIAEPDTIEYDNMRGAKWL